MGTLRSSMQISRPTSPTIRVFVALTLLLSVSAPLVQSICGEADGRDAPRAAEVQQVNPGHLSSCEGEPGVGRAAVCGEGQLSASECTVGVCTVEPDTELLALPTEKPSMWLDLPALLVERISTEVIFSSPPVFRWNATFPGVHLLVPVRLLTSTFLL